MGFGTNIINYMTSQWPSVGIGGGGGRVVKSVATSDSRIGFSAQVDGSQRASEIMANNIGCFGVNDKIKLMLKDYPLTNLFLNIYVSVISDIINKTSFEVKIEEIDDRVIDDINKYIKEIDFRGFIVNNLRSSLFWGSYASPLFRNKENGRYKLGDFIESERLIPAYYEGTLKSYVYKKTDLSEFSAPTDDDVITIPADEVVYLGFDMHRKVPVVLGKDKKKGIDSIIVNLTYRFPMGIFDDCLYLLYTHMLNTYIRQLLTLKNALRPDVLMAQQSSQDIQVTDSTDDIENIEACLNNNEAGVIGGLFGDPATVLNLVTSSVLNQLKVVPSLTNYSNFEIIDFPTLEDKLRKLAEDLFETKVNIGNNLGIPEELLSSSANRWEVVSRSAQLQHSINKRLADISNCLKTTIINYAIKFHGIKIDPSDITVNFDTNNILFNAEYAQKQQLVNDNLEAVSRMVANRDQIAESPSINKEALNKWFIEKVKSLDPALEAVVTPPPLPTVIDPQTGQPLPPEIVEQLINEGRIGPNGEILGGPEDGEEMPEEEENRG